MESVEHALAAKFAALVPHLDERQRRLLFGAEARALGHGGIRTVARAANVAEVTVSRGLRELASGTAPSARTRRSGAGRKRRADENPELVPALLTLLNPPDLDQAEAPLSWTTSSTRKLASQLNVQGHQVGADTVATLLRAEGFRLPPPRRALAGARQPDRDNQFSYVNEQALEHLNNGDPVVSVDLRMREHSEDEAVQASAHRQPPMRTHTPPFGQECPAVSYAVYDPGTDEGRLNQSGDPYTVAHALDVLGRWWWAEGQLRHPHSARLLVAADVIALGHRDTCPWVAGLAELAHDSGLQITVCHLPVGTLRWRAIAHHLFSRVAVHQRGSIPHTIHEIVLNSIALGNETTSPRVQVNLYATDAVPEEPTPAVTPHLTPHPWHGDWNYTVRSQSLRRHSPPTDTVEQQHHTVDLTHVL